MMKNVLYVFVILNLFLILVPFLQRLRPHMDILIIPITFSIAYTIYWNRDRPHFEIVLEDFFRFKILKRTSMTILKISEKIKIMDELAPRYSSLVVLLMLLIGGVIIWFLW